MSETVFENILGILPPENPKARKIYERAPLKRRAESGILEKRRTTTVLIDEELDPFCIEIDRDGGLTINTENSDYIELSEFLLLELLDYVGRHS